MWNEQTSLKESTPVNRTSLKPMTWSRPADMSGEIDLQWLLKVMPAAEAHFVSRVDSIASIAKPGGAQPGRVPNRNGPSRRADWFFETLGD